MALDIHSPSPSASQPRLADADDFQYDDGLQDDHSLDGDYTDDGSLSSESDDGDGGIRRAEEDMVVVARRRKEEEESSDDDDDELVIPSSRAGMNKTAMGGKVGTVDDDTEKGNRHLDFQSPPPSPFLITADTRQRLDPRLIRARDDVFAWKDGRHRCDHKSGQKISRDAPVNSCCALLSFLNGMFFCPLLGAILCPTHHCIVPYSDIPSHLKLHLVALKRSSLTEQQVRSHVHHMFDVPETQDMASVSKHASSLRLSSPIPGLHPPDLCTQCPNCKGWLTSRAQYLRKCMASHWRHFQACKVWYQNQSTPPDPGTFQRLYATPLFHGHSTVKAHRAVFVDDYRPSGESHNVLPASATPRSHFTYHMPEYLENFGWSPYVDGLKADRTTLMQLVATPSDHIANTWPEGSEGRNVEQGLQVVDTFFRNYLHDANYLVNQCHDAVRRAITAG